MLLCHYAERKRIMDNSIRHIILDPSRMAYSFYCLFTARKLYVHAPSLRCFWWISNPTYRPGIWITVRWVIYNGSIWMQIFLKQCHPTGEKKIVLVRVDMASKRQEKSLSLFSICKSQDGVGRFRFVVCNLFEPLPDRTIVVSWELVLEFLSVPLFSFSHCLAKAVLQLLKPVPTLECILHLQPDCGVAVTQNIMNCLNLGSSWLRLPLLKSPSTITKESESVHHTLRGRPHENAVLRKLFQLTNSFHRTIWTI